MFEKSSGMKHPRDKPQTLADSPARAGMHPGVTNSMGTPHTASSPPEEPQPWGHQQKNPINQTSLESWFLLYSWGAVIGKKGIMDCR